MKNICEWNPVLHQAAISTPTSQRRETDCKNEAMWRVGVNGMHLCQTCARLPEFDRFTNRALLKKK